MLSGLPPFYDENTNEMYRKILQDPLRFGDEISPDARHLLTGLLTRDPAKRLGVNGAQDIKDHVFFKKAIDWKKLVAKKVQPPFKPSVASAIDTSNVRSSASILSSLISPQLTYLIKQFDEEFTSEVPMDSVVDDSHLSQTVQEQFEGFTYQASDLEHRMASGGFSHIG